MPFKGLCPSIFYDLPTGLETVDSDFDLPKCGMSIATAAIPLDPSSSKMNKEKRLYFAVLVFQTGIRGRYGNTPPIKSESLDQTWPDRP